MSEPQNGGVQLLLISQGLVHDWIFDKMIGWNLDTGFLFNFNWRRQECLLVLYIFITGLWLMYHVRFAGGRVSSELQFRSSFSPTENLHTQSITQLYLYILTPSLMESRYLWSIYRNHDHQEIPVGAVSGEHGALATDLTPVPSSAGLAQSPKVDRVLGAPLSLQRASLEFISN